MHWEKKGVCMKTQHFTLKELPISERPYEKVEKMGVTFLSDAELLAVFIKTGTMSNTAVDLAYQVLDSHKQHKGLIGLNYLTMNDLKKIHGIGRVKSIQLLCLCELCKRMSKECKNDLIQFSSPKKIAEFYMQEMRILEREVIKLILLDSKSRKINDVTISSGTVNATIAAPREIFIHALKYDAVNIILVHNHPSGDPTPSKEDFLVTTRMKETGLLLGIPLLDHIIIGDNQYISLKEQGFL